jgi:DNA-binding MarR family transcriptional regulator
MHSENDVVFSAFKRLIHGLTVGRRTPTEYAGYRLHKAEVHLVEVIGKVPGITVSDIADSMGVTKGAVSQLTSKLMQKGLIEKRHREDNQRVQALHLTGAGLGVFRDHERVERALVEAVLGELEHCDTKAVARFTAIIDRVTEFVNR